VIRRAALWITRRYLKTAAGPPCGAVPSPWHCSAAAARRLPYLPVGAGPPRLTDLPLSLSRKLERKRADRGGEGTARSAWHCGMRAVISSAAGESCSSQNVGGSPVCYCAATENWWTNGPRAEWCVWGGESCWLFIAAQSVWERCGGCASPGPALE